MRNTIIIAVVIAVLALGIFFAWSRTKKETVLPKIPVPGFQQEVTPSPTPTPTPKSSPVSSVQGIKQTPATGVNLLLPLLGSAGLGLTGWYLLWKA